MSLDSRTTLDDIIDGYKIQIGIYLNDLALAEKEVNELEGVISGVRRHLKYLEGLKAARNHATDDEQSDHLFDSPYALAID